MNAICIREYAHILAEANVESSLDVCSISKRDWEYLEKLAFSDEKQNSFIRVSQFQGAKALKVVNYVGVISTPDGTHIEILPKTNVQVKQSYELDTRKLLCKMLAEVYRLPFIETKEANVEIFNKPLIEALISLFLTRLASVVRRGIRKDYHRIEEEERFLKGQLLMALQLRQPIGKQHLFQISYDVFSENRAENRLIHAALIQVCKWSKDEQNLKLARELRFAFNEIPVSSNYKVDFIHWKDTRDMASYQPLLQLVRLILNQQSPFAIKGQYDGISFLFPMEKLFEEYVAIKMAKQLSTQFELKPQIAREFLVKKPKNAFLLKPDIAIIDKETKNIVAILDTKWKLIDQDAQYDNGADDVKAGISQGDMYQLYAYGNKYFEGGKGKLVLIYPQWEKFVKGFQFEFQEGLSLDVIPFDMKNSQLALSPFTNSLASLSN